MRRLALACLLGLAVAACGGKKESSAEAETDDVECESSDECDEGYVCKKNECVESDHQKMKRRSNNVSPESVKREVEIRQRQHERKVDESLDL